MSIFTAKKLEQEVKAHAPEKEYKTGPFGKKLKTGQIKKLSQAVLEFSEYLCDTKLYPYQREFSLRIIRSLLQEDVAEITALFSRQCIPAGRLIAMADGSRVPVEKISVDAEILSFNTKKRIFEPDVIEDIWGVGLKDRLSVETTTGLLTEASPDHLFYGDDGWKELGKFKVGDRILFRENFSAEWDRVKSLTLLPPVKMYDLTVTKNENFISDKFIVHNSGKTETVAVTIAGCIIMLPILAKYIQDRRIAKYKKGCWIGIFAPAHEQADTMSQRLLDKLRSDHAKAVLADDEINIEIDDRYTRSLSLPNGSIVRTHSAAKQAKIESKTYHGVICVAGDTPIETPNGIFPIKTLVESGYSGKVRGFDHETRKAVWADVLSRQQFLRGDENYEICLENDKKLIATGDHLWFVPNEGYVETRELFSRYATLVQTKNETGTFRDSFSRWGSSLSNKGECNPPLHSKSQRESVAVCGVEGTEPKGIRCQSSDNPKSRLWVYVGSYSNRVQKRVNSLLRTLLHKNTWQALSDRRLALEAGCRRLGVVVARRWKSWYIQQQDRWNWNAAHAFGRFEEGVAFNRKLVSPEVGCADQTAGGQAHLQIFSEIQYRRDGNHIDSHIPVSSPHDAVQGHNPRVHEERSSLHHLSEDVYFSPQSAKEQSLFCCLQEGIQTQVRLRSIRPISTGSLQEKEAIGDWVYDLTTSTGNFFANGVLSHNCEEAQAIDPQVYLKSIYPMISATAGTQVKIGTPNYTKSDFYDACQRNAKLDAQTPNDKRHYQYDYETASKYNPAYKKAIKAAMEQMGFDSDAFRMSYRLHWLLERGMLVDATLFESLGKNYWITPYDNKNDVVVGIDIGKITASTVVTVVQPDYENGTQMAPDDYRAKKRIFNWLELNGDKYDEQTFQITQFLGNYKNIKRIHIDATGIGQHMFDNLTTYYQQEIDRQEMEVIGFIASPTSNSEGYTRLLLDIQNLRLEFPNSDKAKKSETQRRFVAQMTNVRKNFRGALLSVQESEELPMKDYVSSLMLACWGCDLSSEMPELDADDRNVLFGPSLFGRGHKNELFSGPRERNTLIH